MSNSLKSEFIRNCRPRLGILLTSVRQHRGVSAFLVWELLIELLSTIKVTASSCSRQELDIRTVGGFEKLGGGARVTSFIEAFVGLLCRVETSSGEVFAIKAAHPQKATCVRELVTYAQGYIAGFIPYTESMKSIYAALVELVDGELDLTRERIALEIAYLSSLNSSLLVPRPIVWRSNRTEMVMNWVDAEAIDISSLKDPIDVQRHTDALVSWYDEMVASRRLIRYDAHRTNYRISLDDRFVVYDYGSSLRVPESMLQFAEDGLSDHVLAGSRVLGEVFCNGDLLASRGLLSAAFVATRRQLQNALAGSRPRL